MGKLGLTQVRLMNQPSLQSRTYLGWVQHMNEAAFELGLTVLQTD